MIRMHATCVAIDGAGVLLRGPSGAGKSDLALRLIDGGAVLVADDQVELTADAAGPLRAAPPAAIAGRLEVRGIGIVRLPYDTAARVDLVVDLVPAAAIERLPDPDWTQIAGRLLPRVDLAPFEASAPAKLRLALRRATAAAGGRATAAAGAMRVAADA